MNWDYSLAQVEEDAQVEIDERAQEAPINWDDVLDLPQAQDQVQEAPIKWGAFRDNHRDEGIEDMEEPGIPAGMKSESDEDDDNNILNLFYLDGSPRH